MSTTTSPPRPRQRPAVTHGVTERVDLGCNRHLFITINRDEEGLCEVFLRVGKSGGCLASHSEAVGRLISLALRSGIPTEEVVDQLRYIRCLFSAWHDGEGVLSCADAIAQAIDRQIEANGRPKQEGAGDHPAGISGAGAGGSR